VACYIDVSVWKFTNKDTGTVALTVLVKTHCKVTSKSTRNLTDARLCFFFFGPKVNPGDTHIFLGIFFLDNFTSGKIPVASF